MKIYFILTLSWYVSNNDGWIKSLPLLLTIHILDWREPVCWWKNNDPLLTDHSSWLYCGFSPSFVNFSFSDVVECMCNRSLCSEWSERTFGVETGWPSRFSTFPLRECICFKNWCKSLLTRYTARQMVMTETGAFPNSTHSAHFFWQSCPQYVKRSQLLYVVHINNLSVCHIPFCIPRLWLNGQFHGELFHIVLGLLFRLKFQTLDSLTSNHGCCEKTQLKDTK